MPELPEVETMRRGILPIVGATIEAAERPRCARKPIAFTPGWRALRGKLSGRQIAKADRLGKRLVLVLDDGGRLVIEPRMTGLLLLADPPTPDHLRLRLRLSGRAPQELLFWDRRGLGTVSWFDPAGYAELEARLGPDALTVSSAALRERLGARKRPIKVALLDQALVAGVGNIYAAELLNRAKVHPERGCDSLSPREWTRVAAVMREVLEEAVRYEGSTLGDGTYRTALNQDGSYQSKHRVYGREGERCRSCERGTVARIVQAQRATFFCPRCQRVR
ncbi:MAG: bifunctional DNA-formamidopyrimidine glycosylase/DNA-(apurinic or apyrimidinic site) lyase [Planctomycetes bacterium]|nr:bifunctional DNA-formamidopyrimidine glycosylase/DNA-(apurinic or apyrimidinic site) lyase [Planctomycetota bacterium]